MSTDVTFVEREPFIKRLPLTNARSIVDRMLRDKATPSEIAYLHANPILWLRALQRIRCEVESHIAKMRLDREHLKPGSGERPDPEFTRMVAENAALHRNRIHFRELVIRQSEEVKSLYAIAPGQMHLGDVIADLIIIATMIDRGEAADAREKALWLVEKLAARAESEMDGDA